MQALSKLAEERKVRKARETIRNTIRETARHENESGTNKLELMQNALGAVVNGGKKINSAGQLGRFLPSLPSIQIHAW